MDYCKIFLNHPVYYGKKILKELNLFSNEFNLEYKDKCDMYKIADYIGTIGKGLKDKIYLSITQDAENDTWYFTHANVFQNKYFKQVDARNNQLLACYMLQDMGVIEDTVKIVNTLTTEDKEKEFLITEFNFIVLKRSD